MTEIDTHKRMATLFKVLEGDDSLPAFTVTEDGPKFTRGELRADIKAVSVMLAKAGVGRGDVVTMCFRNQIENVISFIAATWIGAIAAPINASYAKAEFAYDMNNLSTKFLLVPAEGHELIESVAAEIGTIACLSVETSKTGSTVLCRSKCEFSDNEPTLSTPEPDDTALFLHTSGTTGKPKGVPLSHKNMLASMSNIAGTYELTPEDKTYLVMPLFHVHGIMCPLFATLFSKGEVIMPARSQGFRVEIFWKDFAAYGATWYSAVPTMHQLLLKALDTYEAAGKPKKRFIRSSSASLPPSVLKELEAQFDAPVLESYAMTEACHQMASNPLPKNGPHKPGSVGRGTNVEICILPEDSETELKANDVGDVCIRGINVTKGYHNRPDATAESFTPSGFFRTGDLGYKDDDGYLYLTGRKKEQINRGGEKLAPVAIDNVLLRCPGVASLFAFGVPHEDLGETVAVIVVLNEGADVSLGQLNRFGLDSGELGMIWLPEMIVYSDKVPKGPTGKVQRVKLAAMLGMPKMTPADAGAAFTYKDGKLERIVEVVDDLATVADADLGTVTKAVGDILGLDVSGMDDQEILIDSFTATRLASLLNRKFTCGLTPKALTNGVTLPKIHELILTTDVLQTSYDWLDEAKVPESISAGIQKKVPVGPLSDSDGAILLTGATGFLGAHMLGILLKTTKLTVICVARAADDATAATRVEAALKKQDAFDSAFSERVKCVAGDINLPQFGLDDAHVADLSKVRLLIHNAAAVNHALPYGELRDANVGSLVRAITLAHTIEAMDGSKAVFVNFVSTAGVCGRVHSPDAEAPPPIPLEKMDGANGYVQGKWVSERLVENCNKLAFSAGAPARYATYRPGAVTGHTVTGACNIGDSINRYIIGFSLLGAAPPLPDMDVRVDQSPVDFVAGAMVGLAIQDVDKGGAGDKTPCYTLDNGNSLFYKDLMKILGLPILETYGEWLEKLEAALKEETSESPHPNPLGGLLGALRASPPKFGSTGSKIHMTMLHDRGYPSPPITDAIIATYLNRFRSVHNSLPPK